MNYKNDIENLLDFDIEKRKSFIIKLADKLKSGEIKREKTEEKLNLHLHSFHSFNYLNWSPSRILLESFIKGLRYTGIVDFDTLEAVEETKFTSELLGISSVNGFETRVFIKDWSDKVINSPGEPGIYYFCGIGFKKSPKSNFFLSLQDIAQKRNKKIVEKLNDFLKDINVDYKQDVIPLTPSGNPTERHIILAFYKKAEKTFGQQDVNFWSEVLKLPAAFVENMKKEKVETLHEKIRLKLIKSGGPGYIFPEKDSFPLLENVIDNTLKEGGIPVGTWLDGTSDGEKNSHEHLELLIKKGIKTIAIIPERNWNIKDIDERKMKTENLKKFLEACKNKKIPVVPGTEMNKFGQPFMDDFTQPILKEYLPYFLESAEILCG